MIPDKKILMSSMFFMNFAFISEDHSFNQILIFLEERLATKDYNKLLNIPQLSLDKTLN